MTLLERRATDDLHARIAAVARPRLRSATVASILTLVSLLGLGIASLSGLGFSIPAIVGSLGNLPQFFARTVPFAWPGWRWDRASDALMWEGWEPVGEFASSIVMTLGIVICGTFLAFLVSIPIAYGAARTTTPNAVVMVICRGIGIVSRAIPAVAFASIFVFLFALGPLPGILAFFLHSIGMISKMMADAIEQVDEGPRRAIRSTGGTGAQQFWSAIVPQAFPAWVAIGLHRADINLRETVILGYVGVAGLGLELANSIHALNYRRAIPIAITIVVLCIVFEVVSSVVRSRLLGVSPVGGGVGDRLVRAASRRSAAVASAVRPPEGSVDRTWAIQAAMKQPWTGERIASRVAVWLTVAVLAASFVAAQAPRGDLLTFWGNLPTLLAKDNLWPPTFGIYTAEQVWGAVLVTFQVAFAATLMSAVLSLIVGSLAASNVAPNRLVRGTFRGLLLIVRGIPELILAIFFVIITGLGAQAGTLALAIGGVGLLGKLIADSLEEVAHGPERALFAVGATRAQVYFSSSLPLSLPAMVGHLLYLLEQNVRAATLLGIVGGGGIGLYLYDSLRVSNYAQASMFIILITVLVIVIEAIAIGIRKALK
ncbi:PhnE/PtxC family ABC transporter permease [Microbacterium sp. IEGM 1404]|uniref:PhnE/PtxC family ABC transporter permease n=1 Tax=Microbacterium sp. IEGM 1404 TaxID=3047084 RepID=UPI0024B6D11E|nr:ABC transporter permease subunit [Microbacterium sp. IEGM 1404]MDI9892637.1 ABC transporter permease subunit [Microbacterium sp. IEGM 1404]